MNAATTHPLPRRVSEIFTPARWREVPGFPHAEADTDTSQQRTEALTDITYHRGCVRGEDGIWLQDLPVVRVAFNRPEVRNAFRPRTVDELYRVLDHARMSGDVGAVILTGNGPSPRDGGWAFSSGGDQRIRGRDGYRYEREASPQSPTAAGEPEDRAYSHEADARFKQTDADVGSFDAGYGSALLARQVGDKRAREIFFLARTYDAVTAERWGVVNEAVPHAELEERALEYAATVAGKSPQAIRMLKLAFNLADDGLAGQQVFAGEATRLAYMTDEAVEGRDAFLQRRTPDWSPFPYYF